MGVMNELDHTEVVTAEMQVEDLTEAQFKALPKSEYDGVSEVKIRTGLNFLYLHAGVYEEDRPTNGIININKPWEIRVYFGLGGPLKELLCGKWCVNANLESIGPGAEIRLEHPEFHFDCHKDYFCVRIPGRGIRPTDCTTPYDIVVTVAAKSLCGNAVGVLGFVDLPTVQFADIRK